MDDILAMLYKAYTLVRTYEEIKGIAYPDRMVLHRFLDNSSNFLPGVAQPAYLEWSAFKDNARSCKITRH